MSVHKLTVKKPSYFGKVVGLIGKKNPQPLLLKTRFGIHTFGVRFPIDVIILNKRGEIVSMKKSLRPNRLFFWNPAYDTVIELPEKTIEKKNLQVGVSIVLS